MRKIWGSKLISILVIFAICISTFVFSVPVVQADMGDGGKTIEDYFAVNLSGEEVILDNLDGDESTSDSTTFISQTDAEVPQPTVTPQSPQTSPIPVLSVSVTGGPSDAELPAETPLPSSSEYVNAFERIEAENFSINNGVIVENGKSIGYVHPDDYVMYKVNFGLGATDAFEVNVASEGSGGNVEIRLDSVDGPVIGTFTVTNTGGWQSWKTVTSVLTNKVYGTHDLYLKFLNGGINVDWFKFSPSVGAYSLFEAEDFDDKYGITQGSDDGVTYITNINDEDFIKFNNIGFGSGATGFEAVVSGTKAGSIDIVLDSPSGTVVGNATIVPTVGQWKTVSCDLDVGVTGVHDVYLVFRGSGAQIFNLDSFRFVDPESNWIDSISDENLKQLLANRIEGYNVNLEVSNMEPNKVYNVYLYTAEFRSLNKSAFSINVVSEHTNTTDSVNSNRPGYTWERKGPYAVMVGDDGKLSINCTATKNKVSVSAIEIEKVTYSKSFDDVDFGQWYYVPVMELASRGIINGTSATEFDPGSPILSKHVAYLLYKMMVMSIEENGFTVSKIEGSSNPSNPMADVDTGFWAYNYMRAYYNFFYKEIPSEFAKGNREDPYVTREEFLLAVVASRRFDYDAKDGKVFVLDPYLEPACRLNDFEDAGKDKDIDKQVNDKLKYFVELGLEKGILNGFKDDQTGKFYIRPKEQVTRAQAATLLYQAINKGENNFIPLTNEDGNYIANDGTLVTKDGIPVTGIGEARNLKKLPSPRITLDTRKINIGILIFKFAEGTEPDPNPDYTFLELLERNINKPMDWELVNPYWELVGEKEKGEDLRALAKSRYGGEYDLEADLTYSGRVGDRINIENCKNFKYWEVDLQDSRMTADMLAKNYDVLFQTSHGTVDLEDDKDKVLQLLKKGGQMWWENCYGLVASNGFAEGITFNEYDETTADDKRYAQIPVEDENGGAHPLLDSLFRINPVTTKRTGFLGESIINSEVSMLGDMDEWPTVGHGTRRILYNGTDNDFPDDFDSIVNVSKDVEGNEILGPSVICKNYDNEDAPDGRLVITANDIACSVSKFINRTGYKAVEDYKFCYNLIAWMSKVSVDFNETSSLNWDNMEEPKITATITNFGGKTQEYDVIPELSDGWILLPTDRYMNEEGDPLYSWILELDGLGYPSKIVLEANEAQNIQYDLKIADESYSEFELKVTAKEANVPIEKVKDIDSSTYVYNHLVTRDINVTSQHEFDCNSSDVDGREEGTYGTFTVKIDSPVSGTIEDAYPYDYVVNLKFEKKQVDDADWTNVNWADIIASWQEVVDTGYTAPHGEIQASDVSETVSEGMEVVNLRLVIPGVEFNKSTQYIKIDLQTKVMKNLDEYKMTADYKIFENGYGSIVGAVPCGEAEPKPVEITINEPYQPTIDAMVLRDCGKYSEIQITYRVPQYTDEKSADRSFIAFYKNIEFNNKKYAEPDTTFQEYVNTLPIYEGDPIQVVDGISDCTYGQISLDGVNGKRIPLVLAEGINKNMTYTDTDTGMKYIQRVVKLQVPKRDDYYISIVTKSSALGLTSDDTKLVFPSIDIN